MLHQPRPAVLAGALTAFCALVVPVLVTHGVADAATRSARPEVGPAPVGRPAPQTADGTVTFPRPGGGPQAIQALSTLDGTAYVLNTRAGEYRKVPYVSVTISPDGSTVAVENVDGQIGVVSRTAVGGGAVRWTSLPPGSPAGWSPDGTALLTTTLDKETRTFTAHRYDVATGQLRHTPINLECDTCTAGWAADSVRYVVQLRGADPDLPTGPLGYLNPDGTPGPLMGAEGHIWDAGSYSPSRRYAVVEPSRGGGFEGADPTQLADWQLPRILDLTTGETVRTLPTSYPVLGWYDERQVVTVAYAGPGTTVLEVVDIHTGLVSRQVSAPGLPPMILQIGSSEQLRADAAEYGF